MENRALRGLLVFLATRRGFLAPVAGERGLGFLFHARDRIEVAIEAGNVANGGIGCSDWRRPWNSQFVSTGTRAAHNRVFS